MVPDRRQVEVTSNPPLGLVVSIDLNSSVAEKGHALLAEGLASTGLDREEADRRAPFDGEHRFRCDLGKLRRSICQARQDR
jgi:hypothetical protein